MQRERFKGEDTVLAAAIDPFVTDVSWLRYSENPKEARVDGNTIRKHGNLVAKLQALQNNLSFTQAQLERVFAGILESKGA
eukprot:1157290-Alexandrium_andersonii.AAC.1